jgi:hypothetical protein
MNSSIFLKYFKDLIDWFSIASTSKKLYIVITIMAFGLYKLITYYDGELKRRDSIHNTRIDNLTNKLEECNEHSKNQSFKLIQALQKQIKESESLKIEAERLKLRVEQQVKSK